MDINLDSEQLTLLDEMAKKSNMSVKELLEALRGREKESTDSITELAKVSTGRLDISTVLMLKALMGGGQQRDDSLERAMSMKMLSQPSFIEMLIMLRELDKDRGEGGKKSDVVERLIEQQRRTDEMIREIALGRKMESFQEATDTKLEKVVSEITNKVESVRAAIPTMKEPERKSAIDELTALRKQVETLRTFSDAMGWTGEGRSLVSADGKLDIGATLDKTKQTVVDIIKEAKSAPPKKIEVQEIPTELLEEAERLEKEHAALIVEKERLERERLERERPQQPTKPTSTPALEEPERKKPVSAGAVAIAEAIAKTPQEAEAKPCCFEELKDGSGGYLIYKDGGGKEVKREFLGKEKFDELKKNFQQLEVIKVEVKKDKKGREYILDPLTNRPRLLPKREKPIELEKGDTQHLEALARKLEEEMLVVAVPEVKKIPEEEISLVAFSILHDNNLLSKTRIKDLAEVANQGKEKLIEHLDFLCKKNRLHADPEKQEALRDGILRAVENLDDEQLREVFKKWQKTNPVK